ncbi:MAG: N-acetyltransferase [Sphingomonadaceae bacterium]|nr:N-acetyltransferase [Sphingomonadaceae bacterium]
MSVTIRSVSRDDAAPIAAIYAHYVTNTAVTFEEVPPDAAEMRARIETVSATHPWLIAATADGDLLGYAYGRPYHGRAAYRWTCETAIYLAHDRRGRGTGRALYAPLLDTLTDQGFVAAIASITVPNAESSRFHEALGFTFVGRMTAIGYKLGRWHDVGYWQRDLGPRSSPPKGLASTGLLQR